MCDPEGRCAWDKKRLFPPCPPHPVLFNSLTPALLPRTPLENLGFENGRTASVKRQKERPAPICSEDQNGDFSPGRRNRQTWGTGTVARKAPEIPGAPSPPDAHAQTHTVTQSHTHTRFWKPLGFLPVQASPFSSPHSWQAPLSPAGPPPPLSIPNASL